MTAISKQKFLITHKVCPVCQVDKSVDEFGRYYAKDRGKYRIQNYCLECQRVTHRKRAAIYYVKNREERLEYGKGYRANPKNKKRLKKQHQKFKRLYIQKLQDCYVAAHLARKWKMTSADIRSVPGLIEAYRAKVLLQREIKNRAI